MLRLIHCNESHINFLWEKKYGWLFENGKIKGKTLLVGIKFDFSKNKDELRKVLIMHVKLFRDTFISHLEDNICVDITPLDLDKMAEEFIISKGGIPGFKRSLWISCYFMRIN